MLPAALLLVAALARAQEPGRAAFEAAGCRACHRVGPAGGDAGPDLTLVGFRRSRAWLELWLEDPAAWKQDTLMPRPRLKPRERAAIADYLASLKGQDFGAAGAPWDSPAARRDPALRGRLVYDRAGCVACHGPRGAGGHPNNNVPGGRITALAGVAGTYTLAEVRTRVRRGSKPDPADPAGPAPLVAMPAWGEVLKDDALDAVSAHVLSLASAPKEEW